jgi:hypothetical protein
MADAVTNNLDNASVVIEKRGRGRPCGRKNKMKATSMTPSSSIAPGKQHRDRPLDSKNKKPSAAAIGVSTAPDIGVTQPSVPQRSSGNIFCFFVFADDQCRERQRLPLKFAEFMDGCEIREAILRETSCGGPPYELEIYYDGEGNVSFAGG